MPGFANLLRPRIQPFVALLNTHRLLLYSMVSTVAVSVAIANALKNHSNFYSVVIYLSKSNRSVLVLANYALLLALLCGRVVQQIFFGPLRAPEVERLYDRLWFFITESLLAFTIFRDDFDLPFAFIFCFLLFIKSFHWLASDRIEWMDQRPYPGPPTLFHIRMNSLFLILWMIDFVMFVFAVEGTMTNGISGMVLFASEYAILMASALNTSAKYFLSLYELRRAARRGGENAPPWENKSMWVFYIELTTDFLKLSTYLVFFGLIITYGLPLNIVRDVYVTGRSFITRLRALQRYQIATRNMDERYPDATEGEMAAMSDRTCIICREEMVLRRPPPTAEHTDSSEAQPQASVTGRERDGPNTTPKKLPCGHVFHFYCLRSWLERQQNCPTCRRTVLDTSPHEENGPGGVGGAPQAPNVFGAAAAPGAQPGPPNNNGAPGGRLFGGGAQPQGGPANLPHGPAGLAVPPQFPGWGQPGGLNGLLIQYNIQYQFPRQQQQQAAQQPQMTAPPQPQPQPQPLQPPPLFNGFQGPGGVWYPWEMDPRWFGQQPANQPLQPPAASSTTAPTPTTTASTAQTQGQSLIEPASDSSPASNTSPTAPLTPRDAAALAASRRSTPDRSSTLKNPAKRRSPPATLETVPSSESSSDSDTSTVSNETAPSANKDMKIPKLIPIYNLSCSPDSATPNGTPYVPAIGSTRGSHRMGPVPQYLQHSSRSREQVPTRVSPPLPSRGHPGSTPMQLNPQRQPIAYQQSTAPRPPISRLPPTLTDAQLAVMDTVTREAIDERLRVLEGVSGAVFRCIEDLMRIRSSLPPLTTTPMSTATNSSASTPNPTVADQSSIATATETLDEAISTAREAAESGSKVEESLRNDLPQTVATGTSSAHAGGTPSLAPPPESQDPL